MTSITNGWNAVCVLDETEVNELFLQQFLNNTVGSPGTPLTFGMVISGASEGQRGQPFPAGVWLGAVALNPPLISLSAMAASQTATISVATTGAAVVLANTTGSAAAMWIPPSAATIQRSVQLQQVTGTVTDSLGAVALNFPGQAQEQNPVSVYDLLANVLATVPLTYNLGEILDINSGPGLQPTSFELALQDGSSGSGELLLLITTSGQPGTTGTIPDPLTGGATAALLISEDLFWSEALPAALADTFNVVLANAGYPPLVPVAFSSQQAGDGSWSTTATAGSANLGYLTVLMDSNANLLSYACSGPYDDFGVAAVPLAGNESSFIVTSSGESIQQVWNATFDLAWFEYSHLATAWLVTNYATAVSMTFSYTCSSPPTLDPTTNIVTFGTSPAFTLTPTPGTPQWFAEWSEANLVQYPTTSGMSTDNLGVAPASSFQQSLTAPAINTFALANLLFPYPTQLTLNYVSLPGDLLLTGSLVSMTTVSPSTATVAPGGTVQFTAAPDDVLWECLPRIGTIDANGLYTAPNLDVALTVKISAVNKQNNGVAYALLQIVPAQASATLIVSPSSVMMTTHSTTIPIQATDASGNPVDVTCSATAGSVKTGTGTGEWTYTSPAIASGGATITVTATADPSLTSSVTISFVTPDTIAVKFDSTSGQASASAQSGYSNFTWAIAPSFVGTITPSDDDPTQATASIAYPDQVYAVCAFYVDLEGGAYGAGQNWQNTGD